jgi:hypothetical protein
MDTPSPEQDELFDDIPLHHKRPFGAGLSRRKVEFVAATDSQTSDRVASQQASTQRIGDLYLSMVLSKKDETRSDLVPEEVDAPAIDSSSHLDGRAVNGQTCPVCKLPLSSSEARAESSSSASASALYPLEAHATSLAHQVCLTHSHPPSHLSRTRMGLLHLEAQGWDPDARCGLGADGQGIVHPIKARIKDDKLGLGVALQLQRMKDDGDENGGKQAGGRSRTEEPTKKLDAKRVRKLAVADKRKADRLQEQMYGNTDLDRYLGRSDGNSIGLANILPRKGLKRKHGIS